MTGSAALRPFRTGLEIIDRVVAWVVVVVVAAMTAIVAAQVLMRYGFNSSLDWAEEVSRLCFVWAIFLAIPLGIKRGAHVGIEIVTAFLPAPVRDLLFRVMCALSAGLMALVAYQGALLIADVWYEAMTTVPLSVGLFLVPVAGGAVHSILHLLHLIATGAPQARAEAP